MDCRPDCETFYHTEKSMRMNKQVQICSQHHTNNRMYTVACQDKKCPHEEHDRERWNKTMNKEINQKETH